MATLITGTIKFINDMKTLPTGVAIWASLFPFPQLIIGGYMCVTRGPSSPAGWLFISRVTSFVIGGQISLQRPFVKVMGPIMHIPFYIVTPFCWRWLLHGGDSSDPNMTQFVAYSTVITTISLFLDSITAVKAIRGIDPGKMKGSDPKNVRQAWIVVVPSILMTAYTLYLK